MKKILASLFIMFLCSTNAFAFEEIFVEERPPASTLESVQKDIHPEITFDWLNIPVEIRTQQAEQYKNIIFNSDSNIYLDKEHFNSVFKKYKRDKNFKHHYMLANNGVTQDEDAKYSPFYYRKNTLIIYAIQYNDDIHNSLYYTAFGKLYYADITSENYPNYQYYSMQYDRKGNLKSAIYFVSADIQYMYNSKKEFIGIWYKDKMYDINGKQISTREGW